MFNKSSLVALATLYVCQGLMPNLLMAQTRVEVGDGIIHFSQNEVRSVAISEGERPHILVALSFDGVASLSAEGQILDSQDADNPLSEIIAVAASGDYLHGSDKLALVAMVDSTRFRIVLRGLDPDSGRFVDTDLMADQGSISVMPRTTHLCFARDRHDDSLYLFAGGDHGRLFQYRIFTGRSGLITIREIQQILIGGPTTSCHSDDGSGIVYVIEPAMGLWQVIADPEEVPLREPVVLIEPYGQLAEPQTLTRILHRDGPVTLLADTEREEFLRIDERGEFVAKQGFAEAFAKNPLKGSIVAIASGNVPLRQRRQDVLVVAVTGDAGTGDIHLLPLASGESVRTDMDRPQERDAVVKTQVISAPVSGGMDAADDPAIWINPRNPADSLVLGADKGAGIGVYDLDGDLLQFLPDGRINNIDLHAGFADNPALAHIAVGSDRSNTALAIYAIDEATRHVSRVDARTIPAEFHDLYGLCMYRSARTGELYAFATSSDGQAHQWRLFPVAGNKVDAELVRKINIGTIAEGCVADDDHGFFYAAEERVGVWRYGAEPGDGDQRTEVTRIVPGGHLAEDLEGLAIYKGQNGEGYLIVTSEGSDNYAVYDRQPPHRYRGSFRIRANAEAGLDGTSQTDGIEVNSAALPGYPQGLFVAQDGRYDESQNFKYVSWQEIAEQLGLEK